MNDFVKYIPELNYIVSYNRGRVCEHSGAIRYNKRLELICWTATKSGKTNIISYVIFYRASFICVGSFPAFSVNNAFGRPVTFSDGRSAPTHLPVRYTPSDKTGYNSSCDKIRQYLFYYFGHFFDCVPLPFCRIPRESKTKRFGKALWRFVKGDRKFQQLAPLLVVSLAYLNFQPLCSSGKPAKKLTL